MKIIAPKRLMASIFPTVRNGSIFNASSLDLQFARTKTLDPRVTFTRASSGTYVGSDGLLKTATTNEARFDHNPTTGESLGLLVEESRTNLLLQSNQFDTTWTNSQSSETAAAGTAPDGTNTAWELRDTVDAVTTSHLIQQTIAFTSGLTYTASMWAKAGTLPAVNSLGILFPSSAFGALLISRFNLSTGIVSSAAAGSTNTITAYPNGWYRCTMSLPATATTSAGIGFRTGTNSATSYVGDGNGTILLWGAQLEAGAFPTSYIPTTTATATRSADVASITGANFSSFYNQVEGTLFADSNQANVTPVSRIVAVSDNASSNRIILSRASASGGNINFTVTDAGIAQVPTIILGTSIAAGTSNKVAAVYKAADFAGIVNGLTPVTQGTGTVPGVLTQLTIGNGENLGSNPMTGTIKRITYWPQRLPNSTLQQITQP
jgi:hypothetical protein